MGQNLGKYPSGGVRRDGETDPLCHEYDGRIYSHDPTGGVQERTPGITGIQRGGVLDDVLNESAVPAAKRSSRALTTPVDTVDWKPNGLPMAITSWPARSCDESPSVEYGRFEPSALITARSVAGSLPTRDAVVLVPSVRVI